jgi:hypothetical protein
VSEQGALEVVVVDHGGDQGGGWRALEMLVRSLGPDQHGGYSQGVSRQICGEGKWG